MPERLSDLAASFSRDLRAEGRSPRTVVIYNQAIRFFAQWLARQGRPETLDELSRSAIRAWLAELGDRNEASTVATRHRSLHRFCLWLVAEGELGADPMAGMQLPKATERPVPVLTDAELCALLAVVRGKGFAELRDAAMFRVLLDCGVRVSELAGLGVSDVDLDHETALVRGKGRKVRAVYFGARTVRALDRYLRERRHHRHASADALWLSQRGPMSADGIREIVRKRGREAGIDDLHPHRFRHTFAHDFLVNGGQERDLKRLAGWSSDVMLERYGASAADERAAAAARRMKRGDRV